MPYVNKPRPYKKEYQQQKARNEKKARAARARARRKIDAKGIDRKNKDVSHKKALSKGGKNSDGLIVQSKSKNRSFKRSPSRKLVSETSIRERKKRAPKKRKV
jgi:hypothetical protein|tara:strand:- start:1500 stop:1808 length:309 start_codon:yes stop_codon:yes gene_type:complete